MSITQHNDPDEPIGHVTKGQLEIVYDRQNPSAWIALEEFWGLER